MEKKGNKLNIAKVPVSRFVDQSKSKLIGYQAYYADGHNKFHETLDDIEDKIASNPLVDIEQVGRLIK